MEKYNVCCIPDVSLDDNQNKMFKRKKMYSPSFLKALRTSYLSV